MRRLRTAVELVVLSSLLVTGCATTRSTAECLAGTAGFLATIGLSVAGGNPSSGLSAKLPECSPAGASTGRTIYYPPPQSEESPPSTEGGGAR